VGSLFIIMVRRDWMPGRLFSLFLILYGVFRFSTEFLRETPKLYRPFSGYQVLSIVAILLGTAFMLGRAGVAPPQREAVLECQ